MSNSSFLKTFLTILMAIGATAPNHALAQTLVYDSNQHVSAPPEAGNAAKEKEEKAPVLAPGQKADWDDIPDPTEDEFMNESSEASGTSKPKIAIPGKATAENPNLRPEIEISDEEETPKGPPPRVEVIVDGSGSMAGLLDEEKTKMFYSKKLLATYLKEQWKEKADVALRVYGSKREKDCSDNYKAVGFRARSLDEIGRRVAVIRPTGKTPIAASLWEAYKDLKSYNGPKRIVLFTDGEETCGGDPCELVKRFQAEGILDLKVYVVAIGMDPEEKEAKGLSCFGDAHTAENEDELFESMGDIQKSMGKGNNLYVDSPNPKARVTVFKHDGVGNRTPVSTFTSSFGTRVPPGEYSAEVKLDPVFEFKRFTIPPRRTVTLKVKGRGMVEVKFVKGLATVELLDKNEKVVYRLESERPYYVEAARYTVRVTAPPFYSRTIRKYYVYPDGEYELDLRREAGVVQVVHPTAQGIYVFSSDKMLGNYVTNVPFVLPNGTYRMFVNKDCDLKRVPIGDTVNVRNVRCRDPKAAKKGKSLQ